MEENNDLFDKSTDALTLKEQLLKFLSYYPLFIISLFICIGSALIYTRFATQKYKAETLVYIKNSQYASASQSSGDLIGTALNTNVTLNIDNEIRLIQSRTVMERVVRNKKLNISYYHVGKIKKVDLYLDAPFRLSSRLVKDSSKIYSFKVFNLSKWGGEIETGEKDNRKKISFIWYIPFTLDATTWTLDKENNLIPSNGDSYIVTWSPVDYTSREILSGLSVSLYDKKTSILQLSLISENLKRGEDILNGLAKEYNLYDMESRNLIYKNTIRFIDERLGIVSGDLTGVENNLEEYQGNNNLVSPESQLTLSFANSDAVTKSITEVNVQQNVVAMISDYFNNPANENQLVPSTLGISDPTLTTLIGHYNELKLKKQRETPLVAEGSNVMNDLNNQLQSVKANVMESLQNITRNLKLRERNFEAQNGQYRQFMSSLPHKERVIQEIKRKQSITENLYLYLLQRREEAAVTSASASISNFNQMDPAIGYGPVEPNSSNIILYSAIFGLALPFGLIFLKDMFNDKVNNTADISNVLHQPVIGEINHISKNKAQGILVVGREMVAEQFRILRTNLYFLMQKENKKVILVTSCDMAEGKSLISLNLAVVLAMPGKKVALLEFDIRKPEITRKLNVQVPYGLSDFLTGVVNKISDLYYKLEGYPNLHIYPAGPIPNQPGDLFMSENLKKCFNELKQQQYDFIIIDSAPVGLVSDAFILGEYSDIELFIVRQRQTPKKQLKSVIEISKRRKLKNMVFVLNDVKARSQYGYYGYGYGYGYGEGSNHNNGKMGYIQQKINKLIKS